MTVVLAVLADPGTARACLDAAAMAAGVDAASRIIAFHVRLDPESLILPTEEVMTEARRKRLQSIAADRARAIRAVFDGWAPAAGTRAAWDEVVGTAAKEVAPHGKTADLVVLAQPLEHEGHDALHAAIFDTGRLLLYVPAAAADRFGAHVGIAWKDCDQARAAVGAALPWLKRARRVSVLAVGADRPPAPPRKLIELLSDNGISADLVLDRRGGDSVGAQLLRQAHAIGADCLVMGAYRHGELMERILGGVTRHMLQAADMPLFLRH